MFICENCGNVNHPLSKIHEKCLNCGHAINWDNVYPNLSINEFRKTAISLLESSKKFDKDRIEQQLDFLKKGDIEIDKTTLSSYNDIYEKILNKYNEHDISKWIVMSDELDEKLIKKIADREKALAISSAITQTYHSMKNPFRKPLVIILASTLELIFSDYFHELIKCRLTPYGEEQFWKDHQNDGISSMLSMSKYFLSEDLEKIIKTYDTKFFDQWKTLRDKRNQIIHNNDKYITKKELVELYKLLQKALDIFLNLKSELYKNV